MKALKTLIDKGNVETHVELQAAWKTYFDEKDIQLRLETRIGESLFRLDASYRSILFEFKKPCSFSTKHSFKNPMKSKAALEAIEQLQRYTKECSGRDKYPVEKYVGVFSDGMHVGVIQFDEDSINNDASDVPLIISGELDESITERLYEQIVQGFSLFSSPMLVRLFGYDSDFAPNYLTSFAKYLKKNLHVKPGLESLFREWKRLFSQISSLAGQKQEFLGERYSDVIASFKDEPEPLSLLLFVIHTYNYFIIRLLAAELVTFIRQKQIPEGKRFSQEILSKRSLGFGKFLKEKLEKVNVSDITNSLNFNALPFFSWYTDAFEEDNEIAKTLEKLAKELNSFDLSSAHLVMEDVLKHLYQNLIPAQLRRALGEFYTPNWMVNYILDECVDVFEWREKRVLDPTCGSGSFLLELIKRKRIEYVQQEKTWYTAQDVDFILRHVYLGASFVPNKEFLLDTHLIKEIKNEKDIFLYVTPTINLDSMNVDCCFEQGNYVSNLKFSQSVLDELVEELQAKSIKARIVSPCFSESMKIWATLEIEVIKNNYDYVFNIYLHNTQGGGTLLKSYFSVIEHVLKQRIKEVDTRANFKFNSIDSPYKSPREITTPTNISSKSLESKDAMICEEEETNEIPTTSEKVIKNKALEAHITRNLNISIVIEEVLARLKGITLDRRQPYDMGASLLRAKHYLDVQKWHPKKMTLENSEQRQVLLKKLRDEELLVDITENIWGFDLNPLAIQVASLNFMLSISDLIMKCWDKTVKIPVVLTDSVYFPLKYQQIGKGTSKTESVYKYKVPHLDLRVQLPAQLVEDDFQIFEKFVEALDEYDLSKTKSSFENFKENHLKAKFEHDNNDNNTLSDSKFKKYEQALINLYDQIYSLRKNKQDGVWLQIIRNFLIAVNAGRFHIIIGNPPWVGWNDLPEEYRRQVVIDYKDEYPSLINYKSKSKTKNSRAQSEAKQGINLAALIVYTTADKWLQENGKLAMVIPTTMLKDRIHNGFRLFKVGNMQLIPKRVDNFEGLKLFDNDFKRSGILSLIKQKQDSNHQIYPVPYNEWKRLENAPCEVDTKKSKEEILSLYKYEEHLAKPAAEDGSPWDTFLEKHVEWRDRLDDFSGQWQPNFIAGIQAGCNPIYYIKLLSAEDQMARIKVKAKGGKKKIEEKEARVEVKFIYPLIKGAGDVRTNYFKCKDEDLYAIIPNQGTSKEALQKAQRNVKEAKYLYAFFSSYKKILQERALVKRSSEFKECWWGISYINAKSFLPYKVVCPDITDSKEGFRVAVAGPAKDMPGGINTVYIPDHKVYFKGFEENKKEKAYYLSGLLNSKPIRDRVMGSKNKLSLGKLFDGEVLKGLPKYEKVDEQSKDLIKLILKVHNTEKNEKRAKLNADADELAQNFLLTKHTLIVAKKAPTAQKGIRGYYSPVKKTKDLELKNKEEVIEPVDNEEDNDMEIEMQMSKKRKNFDISSMEPTLEEYGEVERPKQKRSIKKEKNEQKKSNEGHWTSHSILAPPKKLVIQTLIHQAAKSIISDNIVSINFADHRLANELKYELERSEIYNLDISDESRKILKNKKNSNANEIYSIHLSKNEYDEIIGNGAFENLLKGTLNQTSNKIDLRYS